MSLNILVAEDNEDIAEIYDEILSARGHRVELTFDGEQCVDRYKTNLQNPSKSAYDVVILDHAMPIKDGADAAKEILKENPEQRIIFVTAHGQNLIPSLKEMKGQIDLLTKPCGSNFLIDLIEHRKNSLKEKLEKKRFKRWSDMDTERFSNCDIDYI